MSLPDMALLSMRFISSLHFGHSVRDGGLRLDLNLNQEGHSSEVLPLCQFTRLARRRQRRLLESASNKDVAGLLPLAAPELGTTSLIERGVRFPVPQTRRNRASTPRCRRVRSASRRGGCELTRRPFIARPFAVRGPSRRASSPRHRIESRPTSAVIADARQCWIEFRLGPGAVIS